MATGVRARHANNRVFPVYDESTPICAGIKSAHGASRGRDGVLREHPVAAVERAKMNDYNSGVRAPKRATTSAVAWSLASGSANRQP